MISVRVSVVLQIDINTNPVPLAFAALIKQRAALVNALIAVIFAMDSSIVEMEAMSKIAVCDQLFLL